ncbi:indole-3-glycerol-phosphate synthase [Brevundimonas sp.]|uniref:indole-3-glycerol-phosphate synthase n=1 Tax=Brevundimonas sp. TaxID=1871086 RepID=UPI00289703E7|nr:indole-3-glycerol-phosphate synthase [Brevundimonas sp.]
MRNAALILVVASAALLSACEFEGGDPVQHALRDAAAARQAAALKTTEEQEVEAIRRPTASGPALHEPDELSRLIAARRQAVEETRAALAAVADPALKAQLAEDLKAEEASLRALEARRAAQP